jgi:TonB-linked SusC/RagA family outer membrane protein
MKKKRLVVFTKATSGVVTQFILCLIFTCVAFANTVGSQVLEKEITLSINNTEIKQILRQIQKKVDVKFVYSPTAIDVNRKITVHFFNKKLREILDETLAPLNIHYKVMNDRIILFKAGTTKEQASNGEFIDSEEITLDFENWADRTISGKVLNENNEPLPGVNVLIKGTTLGTTTDVEGQFTLSVPTAHEEGILQVSFIGYKASEISIKSQSVFNIQLVPDVTSLQEVVVVGFGEQRKISVVGANSEVKVGELRQPVANIGTMLAGRVAGIVQVQRTGEPGRDAADIWIRGLSSWPQYGGVRPLVLVDGVERSLDNIDPQDIESFNILKDASATAVYGMRGANGVILINTKAGKIGKTRIDVNFNQGVTTFTQIPELADGPTFMQLTNEARTTRGKGVKYSQEQIDKTISGEDPYVYPNVNWFKEVFNESATNRRVNMNASGGVEKAKYYVSLSYYDEEGFFKTDGLEKYNSTTRFTRYNFTSNINFELTRTTRLDMGVQGFISNANYPGEASENVFGQIMLTTPVIYPVMYPGGMVPGTELNGDFRNPYADITQRGYRNQFRNQIFSNVRMTQQLEFITKGLSVTSMFSFDALNRHDINRTKRKDTWTTDAVTPRNPDGTLNLVPTFRSNTASLGYGRVTSSNRRFYTESALNYSRTFDKHFLTGMLLFNQTDFTDVVATGDNFENSIPFRNRGTAGRVTYSYNDRYFAEVNFGYNGSENFAPSRRYGFFPSYAVGWVISEENFYAPFRDVVQFLKVRFSDGLVGISGGGRRFGYLTIVNNQGRAGYTYGLPGGLTESYGGIEISDYAVDVGWATSRKSNLGIDLRTFGEKVSLNVDLWREKRTDVFLPRAGVLDYVGLYNFPWANLGIIKNQGIDVAMEATNVTLGKTVWTVRGNFNYNRDEIIENDQPKQLYPWLESRGSNVLAYWGFQAEGLFESQDEIDAHAEQRWGAVQPGDIKYKDMNGDGLIDNSDRIKIGTGDVPRITYGVGFNMAWNNFDIGAFFQGTAQADRQISGFGVHPFSGVAGAGNIFAVAKDRWTEENPNPNAMYPRLTHGSENSNNTQASSWWVRDVSFIRLKTFEIGYTLPKKLFSSIGVRDARLYMTGVNLLTFSKFKLWDPELNTSNGARYPNVRTISLGINVSF